MEMMIDPLYKLLWDVINGRAKWPAIDPLWAWAINDIGDPLTQWLLNQVVSLAKIITDNLLIYPIDLINDSTYCSLYMMFAKIASCYMLPVFGWINLKLIFGKVSIKDLPVSFFKMLGFPLFVGLFLPIIRIVIKVINEMTRAAIMLMPLVKPQSIKLYHNYELGLIIFLAGFIYYAARLLYYYGYRDFLIIVLILFSPIIYLLWCIPKTEGKLELFLQDIFSMLIIQIIHGFLFSVLFILTILPSAEGNIFRVLFIQIGGLAVILKSEKFIGRYLPSSPLTIANTPNKLAGWMKKGIGKGDNIAKKVINRVKK